MSSIKILIADDHLIVLEGLIALLKESPDIEVVHQASNGEQVLKLLKRQPVDIVVLDYEMPIMNGLDTTEKIVELYPDVKVLILTMYNKAAYVAQMIEVGASGYILKGHGRAELEQAIRAIYKGGEYFGEPVKDTLIQSFRKDKDEQALANINLTKREKEILCLIANGQSTPEIADKLFIARSTVNTHRRNLIEKLGVSNTKGLVKYAVKHGFV